MMIIYLKTHKQKKKPSHSYSDLMSWMEVLPDSCHWEKYSFLSLS